MKDLMVRNYIAFFILAIFLNSGLLYAAESMQATVRIKDLSRVAGVRDNSLIGYGLITGLSGTGDGTRNKFTAQSVNNLLERFGVHVSESDIYSRNVAAVAVTATLPAFASSGDKLDINVTSVGDARSLFGGTLLLTNLTGPDGITYALAQGSISVGGFKHDVNGNSVQKNHPTSGTIPGGATVEKFVSSTVLGNNREFILLLNEPDNTTADRVMRAINNKMGADQSAALDAGRIMVKFDQKYGDNLVGFLAQIESIEIKPDYKSVVVINERTGTVVSGGDVSISPVSITQGGMKISVKTEFSVSQPVLVSRVSDNVRTQVVSNSDLAVSEEGTASMNFPENTSVSDLILALNKGKINSRDIISILLSIKKAGALHAELIIQ